MKIYLLIPVVFLTMTASVLWSQSKETIEKERVITELYKKIKGFTGEGIPKDNEIDSITPFLSTQLVNLFCIAWEKELQYESSLDVTPPLIEGNMFTSSFEGYTSIHKIWKDTIGENRFYVEFEDLDTRNNYGKNDGKEPKSFFWVDRIIMKKEDNNWVVDDIELLNKAAFGIRGSIRDILIEIGSMEFTKD